MPERAHVRKARILLREGIKKLFSKFGFSWFGQITVLFILGPYQVQAGLSDFSLPNSSQSLMVCNVVLTNEV
jgi:hypothetical protein